MKLRDTHQLFTALADPTRLRIVSLLNEGELCVCDIITVLNEPQSKVSRHLGYLKRAGLVQARKDGLWMHYRLSKPVAKLYRMLLDAVCCSRSECEELEKDIKALHSKRNRLVSCCK